VPAKQNLPLPPLVALSDEAPGVGDRPTYDRKEGNVNIVKTRLLAIPLALTISGFAVPSAYSQNVDSKTGVGQRGTPVAPSTDPSQAGSTSTPRPPAGLAKSGTPVEGSKEAMSGKMDQSKVKAKGP
jgi:hypothetical protein